MDSARIILRCYQSLFEVVAPGSVPSVSAGSNAEPDYAVVFRSQNYEAAFQFALELSGNLGIPIQNDDTVCPPI
ncbi:MAG: hypothetical protein P4N59_16870 [Negativicutes bacterium]|nr:hypothetical protein [Negativicutes bacterium]